MTAQQVDVCFESLPVELRHQIFNYLYPPWHLEYTQEHDTTRFGRRLKLLEAACELAVDFSSTPRFSNLPSIAPLLVCKAFHDAGKDIFRNSFTGHVHVVSRSIWSTIHWTYECILAKATDLTIDDDYFWTFRDLKLLQKMVNLQRIVIVMSNSVARGRLDFEEEMEIGTQAGVEDGSDQIVEVETDATQSAIPLENAELRSFLPASLDLRSDIVHAKLESMWSGLVAGSPSDWRIQMQTDPRMRMEMLSHDIQWSRKISIAWRCVMKLPCARHVAEDVHIFLALDYHYEFKTEGFFQCTGTRQPTLIRKKLVKWVGRGISDFNVHEQRL